MATKKKKTATKATKKSSTTATKAAKKPQQAAAPTEVLLVGSKVRQEIKDAGFNTGGDAIEGLNEWVHMLIRQATQRAEKNGRKTVRAHDFMA